MKHKVLAILLCLAMVLTMALPGTLAVSADEDSSESQLTMETCTCGAEDDNHAEDCPKYVQPEPSEEEPVCTCGTEDDTHAEDCPLYVAPVEEPICTCGAEDGIHAEDCPLYDAGDDSETEETTAPTEDEEEPEGTPPESWGSASLAGAVSFTNVAPLMPFDYGIATLELNDEDYGIATQADNNNGIVLNKTATANGDGSFKITLEAYATGEQTTVSHYDPADIVLVLDTSASMFAGMQDSDFEAVYDTGSNSFSVTKDSDYYTKYQKYWIKNDDGEYVNACYYANKKWATQDAWNANSTFAPKTGQYDFQSGHKQFYVVKNGVSRMDSLKTSVNSFISSVFSTSAESSIAIVPFDTTVGTVTDFTSNQTTLNNAVAALTPSGGTNSGSAMAKAVELLNSDSVKNNGHKKVVVMFTDGTPCSSGNAFDSSIANTAISNSHTLKTNGVTVYTVGVFSGANGVIASVGSSNENTYMHYVSSNYPEASSMTSSGKVNEELNGKSYYLSATNASELQNIFQLISQQVGGATNTTLDSSTVVKDIIAPSFTVPENTSDVKIYTADCTGAGLTFGNRVDATGVTATIEGDTLNVTGFNFSANWCGSHSGTYSGKKLIIEFTVSPKEGFLGGNGVPTNGEKSGVYVGGENIANFEVPTVNVPIADITITATDKNVYLMQIPTEEQLKSDVTIKCGDVDITDPSKLEDWQKAYVNLESSFTNANGFDATSDSTYTVTATVSPKTTGDSSKPGTVATAKNGTETKNINVFKPELTYKDSEIYYGDNEPTSYDSNLSKTEWKHGNTLSTAVTMIGTAPTLDLTYTPDSTKIENGKINSKSDIAVDVAVKIGTTNVANHTTFQHTDCTGRTCSTPESGKFWLHVKTCQLTITKTGGAADESYVFDVYKDGEKYTEVTIWGNGSETIYELPVGNYTIQENTGWSWRYSADNGSAAALSAQTPSGSITCTNTSTTDKWLNGFSTIVKNIYGKTSN